MQSIFRSSGAVNNCNEEHVMIYGKNKLEPQHAPILKEKLPQGADASFNELGRGMVNISVRKLFYT